MAEPRLAFAILGLLSFGSVTGSIGQDMSDCTSLFVDGIVEKSCYGMADCTIQLGFTYERPFKKSWDHRSKESYITQLEPGKYEVAINDRYGRSVERQFSIWPYGENKIEISNNNNCLRAIISKENGPYKINWISRDGIEAGNIEEFQATKPGTYAAVIIDKNNSIITSNPIEI